LTPTPPTVCRISALSAGQPIERSSARRMPAPVSRSSVERTGARGQTARPHGHRRPPKVARTVDHCPPQGSIERGSPLSHGPVKFRPAQFHIVASQLPCVGRKLRPQQAWVHSVGNRGWIYWPFSGPSEPPCRTAAIDRSCTICAARGRSGSSVTADKPV
jgi:hypothetical protein